MPPVAMCGDIMWSVVVMTQNSKQRQHIDCMYLLMTELPQTRTRDSQCYSVKEDNNLEDLNTFVSMIWEIKFRLCLLCPPKQRESSCDSSKNNI